MLGDIFGVDGIIVLMVVLVVLFGGRPYPSLPGTSDRPRTSSKRA